MYKILVALFFLGFCYSETQACEWWNTRVQPVVITTNVPSVQQPVIIQQQFPVVIYQPVVVQQVRLIPVIETRVVYQPLIRY